MKRKRKIELAILSLIIYLIVFSVIISTVYKQKKEAKIELGHLVAYNQERYELIDELIYNATAGLKKHSENDTEDFKLKLAFYKYVLLDNTSFDEIDEMLESFEEEIRESIDEASSFDQYYLNILDSEKELINKLMINEKGKTILLNDTQKKILQDYWKFVLVEVDFNLENRNFARDHLRIDLNPPN